MKRVWIYFIALAFFALCGYFTGRYDRIRPEEETVTMRVDTITIHDTVHLEHFREVAKMVRDTMTVAVTDTVVRADTVFIRLPRTELTVRDSLFTAQISGYEPRLDWIDITTPLKVISVQTTTQKPAPRWSIGVTAGPSALISPKGQLHAGVGLTAGVQYRF